jgi:hypothetical protein
VSLQLAMLPLLYSLPFSASVEQFAGWIPTPDLTLDSLALYLNATANFNCLFSILCHFLLVPSGKLARFEP